MAARPAPAEMRAYIVERLVGETGEPDHVIEAARALAERARAGDRRGLGRHAGFRARHRDRRPVELARFADARPKGDGHAMTVASSPSSPDALILLDRRRCAWRCRRQRAVRRRSRCCRSRRSSGRCRRPRSRWRRWCSRRSPRRSTARATRAFEFKLPLPPALTGAETAQARHPRRPGRARRLRAVVPRPRRARIVADHAAARAAQAPRRATSVAGGETPAEKWRSASATRSCAPQSRSRRPCRWHSMTLGELSPAAGRAGRSRFDESAQSQARLSARDKTLFVCEFGKLGQNYTVRIRHPFDAGAGPHRRTSARLTATAARP